MHWVSSSGRHGLSISYRSEGIGLTKKQGRSFASVMPHEPIIVERDYEKAFAQLGAIQPIFPAYAKRRMAGIVHDLAQKELGLFQSTSASGHYSHMERTLKDSFARKGVHIDLEPSGSRGPDIVGINMSGDLTIGEIKHSVEIHRDLRGYWSQWNSQSSFGGKTPDFSLKSCYSDQGAALSADARGWTAVIDGQLRRSYCEKAGVADGILVVENYGAHDAGVEASLRYLKAQGRISGFKVSVDQDGNGHVKVSFTGIPRYPSVQQDIKTEIRDAQNKALLKDMRTAAVSSAAVSALASGVINSVRYFRLVQNGELDEAEAAARIIGEVAASAADSAIKASANVGVQGLLARYGVADAATLLVTTGEKQGLQLLARNGLRSMLRTNAVTVGVICGVDLVKDLVRLASGRIDPRQFEHRCGNNLLTTTSGVFGAAIGADLAVVLGPALGLTSKTLATMGLGLAGGMAGGLIAGLAMQFAIENHIEKPYHELIANTESTRDSLRLLEMVSRRMLQTQVLFTAFLDESHRLDRRLEECTARLEDSWEKMNEAIDKL